MLHLPRRVADFQLAQDHARLGAVACAEFLEDRAQVGLDRALADVQGGGHVANLDTWQQQFISNAEFDPRLCLVVSNAEGILGVAQCWTSAFIKNLAIHPCAQGQGLGRALLLHSFQVFKQRGEPYVDLKVLESNLRARQLYESAGMVFVLRDVVSDD